MGLKSRGNWMMGICLPTCKCRNCRMDRFEEAKSRISDERKNIRIKLANDKRKLYETIYDQDVAVMGKKRVYLYGQMKGNSHLEKTIKKQLLGE